jgi:transcription elongation factor GreB
MSKAFTRESDDLPDPPPRPRPSSGLPAGAKNYLTPGGARQLAEELERLVHTDRPQLAANSQADAEAGARLVVVDQRIQHLQQSLESAVVVPAPTGIVNKVRFGATIVVRESNGEESTYRIVGVDETDIDRGWISWLSPIAKALINTEVGQRVRFRFPSGEQEFEIMKITYE